jgi:voltage-gated potassium channel
MTTLGKSQSGLIRGRYRAFVDRHEVAWELGFAALAVFFVALAFVPFDEGSQTEVVIYALEWFITGIFIAEFVSRLWAAESRQGYVRGHWIDLISCIPPTRWLRPFRLLRLLRLVRAFAGVGRALTAAQRLAQHKGLIWLFVAWVSVMFLTSFGLYISEGGVNQAVQTPLDALWWGLTTMTTVGYGDVYPTTAEGRLSAAVLMILGIGLYSAITATLTSFLISGDRNVDLADQLERLAKLHEDGRLTDREFANAKAAILADRAAGERLATQTPDGGRLTP